MKGKLLVTSAKRPPEGRYVKVVKSISFEYGASEGLALLFQEFRSMCNDAVRIAFDEKPSSRFNLIKLAYRHLKEYGLHTHYILNACEVAYSLYKKRNGNTVPLVKKAFLKLDNQSYKLNHLLLRIPSTPRRFVFLTLEASDYHLSFVHNPNLRKGSITITERSVSMAFSKEVELLEPVGCMGLDVNEGNVTVSSTDGYSHQFMELGEVVQIKERYKAIRAKMAKKTRRDRRVGKELFAKYGRRERDRTTQRINNATRRIVDYAETNKIGIKMERLRGIRRLYRRGNGQGTSFRGRMNSWVFGETQRQIDYKAKWAGVPVWYVNPRGTSRNCPDCGSRVAPLQDRKLFCAKCDIIWDRDDLASKNIMVCVVPQARPSKGSDEGEGGDDGSNSPSGWREVDLVTATKFTEPTS